jgi:SWI/SNF-related matrix-associated actin-dependent regulator 1 of chromatin subfamily A
MAQLDVFFSAPDSLVMTWPFQQNWKDINTAVKSLGDARFNMTTKAWSIPITSAPVIAESIRPHYEPLSEAILAVDEVSTAVQSSLKRVELSNAVDTDNGLLKATLGALVQGEPYPHQYVAADVYVTGERHRILIADEMGLGKSLSALLCVLAAEHKHTLIVCPASVKVNWEREIHKWLPQASTEILSGFTPSANELPDGLPHFVVVNYHILPDRLEMLQQLGFDCIIFDECHALKNRETKRATAARHLVRWPTIDGLIFMSGTPVLNRPNEFFSTLNMMLPTVFKNWWTYAKRYCAAYQDYYGWKTDGASNIDKSDDGVTPPLAGLLKDIMLRRMMDDPRLADTMPSLIQTIHVVELQDGERNKYDNEFNQWMTQWDSYRDMGSGSMPPGWTLNMLTELRHYIGRLKVRAAADWAIEYRTQGDKPLVIFAHHKDVLWEVTDILDNVTVDWRAELIDGSTSLKKRQEYIDAFQAGDIDFLVCSTIAMKEGVNLERADTTLFIEREWVPAYESQAAARVRRLTQESQTCHQVILSASDSVDEHFDRVISSKSELVKRMVDNSGDSDVSSEMVSALLEQLEVIRQWE